MIEVHNIEDAKSVVVISESFGEKKILKEIYFDKNDYPVASMIKYSASHYPFFFDYNNRIDIYKVKNGRKIAMV